MYQAINIEKDMTLEIQVPVWYRQTTLLRGYTG